MKEESEVDESPFARLKRRALQRKLQSLQQTVKSEEGFDCHNEEKSQQQMRGGEEIVEKRGSHKKHQKKNKPKHKKKSKKERQIYMPPALKNAAQDPTKEEISPVAGTATPTIKVAPQRRGGPHPIAAAWAAGLSLSAKGSAHFVRRSQNQSLDPIVSVPLDVTEAVDCLYSRPVEPMKKVISAPSSESASQPIGAVIKSFSEIMAEKKRRRIEMQKNQQDKTLSTTYHSSSSSISYPTIPQDLSEISSSPPRLKHLNITSSPVKPADPRPRVTITPIVFNDDNQSPSVLKRKAQPWTSATASTSPQLAHVPQQIVAPISSTISKLQSLPSLAISQSEAQSISLLSSSMAPLESAECGNLSSTVTGGKRNLGQKKLFKKKKQVESLTSDTTLKSPVSIASMDISIPLPPMTLEEELLLDERSQSTGEKGRTNENNLLDKKCLTKISPAPQQGRSDSSLKATQLLKHQLQRQTQFEDSVSPTITTVAKHKLPSTDSSETSVKKSRLSLDDEFALFDMENFGGEPSDPNIGDAVEPIDDLLQNIDDLLA